MRSRSYSYPFNLLLIVVLFYCYLKVAQIVILSCFRPLSDSILVKIGSFTRFQLVCDRRTDGPTDTPSYRDARTHLKTAWQRWATAWKIRSTSWCYINYVQTPTIQTRSNFRVNSWSNLQQIWKSKVTLRSIWKLRLSSVYLMTWERFLNTLKINCHKKVCSFFRWNPQIGFT